MGSIGKSGVKFKSLVVLFNAGVVIFFILLVTLPLLLLGRAMAGDLLSSVRIPAAALLLGVLGIDVFFAFNFRLIVLLEREDWHALARYLEHRVMEQGRFEVYLVELLAKTWLMLSNFEGLGALENRVAQARPLLLEKRALLFGALRILGGDYAGAERFFAARPAEGPDGRAAGKAEGPLPAGGAWLRWYRAFTLVLTGRREEGAALFAPLARFSRDALVAGLSAWFLEGYCAPALPEQRAELSAAALRGRERVLSMAGGRESWERAAARRQGEVYVTILAKYLAEAADWIYGPPAEPENAFLEASGGAAGGD
jgi:hypothetical protein